MFFDNLKVACAKNGTSPTTLLKNLGMSTSSVTSWKKGVSPSMGTVYRLAEALGVDPKELIDGPATAKKEAPTLTQKDERDIARHLEQIMEQLDKGGDLMFDGDPMSAEARDSIRAAMKLGLEAAKVKNKERFTPKKYRKE